MLPLPPLVDDNSSNDAVYLADWVELNLLLNKEQIVSVMNIIDELTDIPPDYMPVFSLDFSEDRQLILDQEESKADAAFHELVSRSDWLGDRYPIVIENGVALLRVNAPTMDVYRFLILLRARQMYSGNLDDDGEESGFLFEEIVSRALGAYTAGHQVRFGVAGGQRGGGLPQSSVEALHSLSSRMHEYMAAPDVSAKSPTDFGGDAVAWKSFGDERPGKIILIGQATISEGKWMSKEPSAKWINKRLIRFLAPPIRAVAFAETLSLTSQDTLDGTTFSSIPFDRLRLLSVLVDEDLPRDLRGRMNEWSDHVRASLER